VSLLVLGNGGFDLVLQVIADLCDLVQKGLGGVLDVSLGFRRVGFHSLDQLLHLGHGGLESVI
jgi:hypothetical protein